MHPLLKRILLNGALTAVALAGVGLLFAHFAGQFAPVGPRTGSESMSQLLADSIRTNVPFMMAFWGFVFVVVCEVVRWRLWDAAPVATPPAQQPPDDVEKLLNELLEQAEHKRTESQPAGSQEEAKLSS